MYRKEGNEQQHRGLVRLAAVWMVVDGRGAVMVRYKDDVGDFIPMTIERVSGGFMRLRNIPGAQDFGECLCSSGAGEA